MPRSSSPLVASLALALAATTACSSARDHGPSDGGVDMAFPGVDSGFTQTDGGVQPPVLDCPYPDAIGEDVAAALNTGDASDLSEAQLLGAAVAYMDSARARYNDDIRAVLGRDTSGTPLSNVVGVVTWDPTHDGALLTPEFGASGSLLGANQHADGPRDAPGSLAVLGRTATSRYIAFGGNPFRNSRNAAMTQLLRNAVAWLTGQPEAAPGAVVMAHLAQSFFFPDEVETRAFFDAQYGAGYSANAAGACDGAALGACLDASPSLLVVSQHYDDSSDDVDAIVCAVRSALTRGIPVVYVQYDGGINPLGTRLLELLGTRHAADNYWPEWQLSDYDASAGVGDLAGAYADIARTLTHLRDGDYAFDLPALAADPSADAAFQAEFMRGAEATRDTLAFYDQHARNPFAQCGHELAKLLVLTGDALRRSITYPMPADTTAINPFLRAYFADHSVLSTRFVGPAQPDRGNFDPLDHGDVVPTTREVRLTSRPNFRATGAYLLPGRTAVVTRVDTAATETRVFVNTLHAGATHEWEGYARPRYLKSQSIPIGPGESRVLHSPYGGPIQIAFEESRVEVAFRFENVGEHPFWDDPSDDATFAAQLHEREYHWVEVASAGFELHSRRDLFDETLQDARWSVPATLSAVMQEYTFSASHVLAGFRGRGLLEHSEVHGWADAAGIPVRAIDVVKHGNMDQARCGYGCSGNPYDAYWAFDPLSHGDLHELGHGLQRGILQFTHGATRYENHAATNWTPFYVASRYYDDHGGAVADWTIDAAELFAALQSAYTSGERAGTFSTATDAFLETRMINGGAIRDAYAFLIQAMASAVHAGVLSNGYHVIPRVHLLEDALNEALGDDVTWMAGRAAVGMETLSRAEAEALTVNERLAILMSQATERDYTDYFDMWGVSVGAGARAQVVAHGYPAVPRAFFVIEGNAHKEGALSSRFNTVQRIVIDGTTAWPTP